MRISDWSSDVCSSDLLRRKRACPARSADARREGRRCCHPQSADLAGFGRRARCEAGELEYQRRVSPTCRSIGRSEEHTSELQSLMRISYAVFCLKKKKHTRKNHGQTGRRQRTDKHKTEHKTMMSTTCAS